MMQFRKSLCLHFASTSSFRFMKVRYAGRMKHT